MSDQFFDWSAESLATIGDIDSVNLLLESMQHMPEPSAAIGTSSTPSQPSRLRLRANATPFTPSSRDKSAENIADVTKIMTVNSGQTTSKLNSKTAKASTSTGKIESQEQSNKFVGKAAKDIAIEETVPEDQICKRRGGKSSKPSKYKTHCEYATQVEKAAFRFDADEFPSLVSDDQIKKSLTNWMSKNAQSLTPVTEPTETQLLHSRTFTATTAEQSPSAEWKSMIGEPFRSYKDNEARLAANFPKLNEAETVIKSRCKQPATIETESQQSPTEPATVGTGDKGKMATTQSVAGKSSTKFANFPKLTMADDPATKSHGTQPATTETELRELATVGVGDNLATTSVAGKSSMLFTISGTRHLNRASNVVINTDGSSSSSSAADDETNLMRLNRLPIRRELCLKWLRWKNGIEPTPCPHGKNCKFAHGEQQLEGHFYRNFRTELCRFWNAEMACAGGAGCNYAHGERELRRLDPTKNGPNWMQFDTREAELLDWKHQYHVSHRQDQRKIPNTSTVGAYLPQQNTREKSVKKIVIGKDEKS